MLNFDIDIDTSDLERRFAQLTDGTLAKEVAAAVADEAVIPEWAKYPPRSGKKQPFKSAKQRAFVHALAKRGGIPYRRTGAMGRNDGWQKQADDTGMTLTHDTPNIDLVRVKGKQAKYHEETWAAYTDVAVAAKVEGDLAEVIGTAKVVELLQRAGVT